MKTKFSGILTLFLAFVVQISFAQEKTISGVVSDDNGLPLPSATVTIVGTSNGTSTDFDGNYSIKAQSGDELQYSYVGYANKIVKVGASNTISVNLALDNSLDEVVIEAYSNRVISKEKSTSAITTLTSEAIEERANGSVVQMLQGQVAGLNIGTGSGQPGANSTILLRGQGSINGNIEPLFIIDGVPVDEDNFRSINNADIASISVLKDASASSLYGSRGANGAIIMTTKRGKFNSGLSVDYRSQVGISTLPKPDFAVMDSRQKLLLDRQLGQGQGAGLSDAAIDAISSSVNTDWADILLEDGFTEQHNLSLSSGGENSNSFNSIGYFEQEGVTRRSNLKRFSFRNNYSAKSIDEKFNFSSSLTTNFSESDFIQNEGQGFLSNPFLVPYVALPYLSAFNPDGSLNTVGAGVDTFPNTPFTSLNNTILNTSTTEEVKIIGNLNARYELIKNITAGVAFGIDYTQTNGIAIEDPISINGSQAVAAGAAEFQGQHAESFLRDVRFNNVVSLGYSKEFNEAHTVDFTAYTEYNKSHLNTNSLTQFGLNPRLVGTGGAFIPADTFDDLNDNGEIDGSGEFPHIPNVTVGETQVGLFSYFGVFKYDYKERYGLQLSGRRDASSRFSTTNRWASFYSVSARWNIHNEAFMDDVDFVNNLKIRVSNGTSGNDRITGGYYGATTNTFDLYEQGTGYNGTVAVFPSSIANNALKWEKTTQTNIGIDFAVLNNSLSGSFDFYKKTTDDLFQNLPISSLNGTNAIAANVGSLENKGIETTLNWRAIKGNDFKLTVFANASYNKNEITELPKGSGEFIQDGPRTVLSEGESLGSFFVVRWAGVNPANGQPLYLDKEGNITDIYNEDNRVFVDKSRLPTYQGGFGFNSSYKGFSFDTQFSFVAETYRYNGSLGVIEDPGLTGVSNSSVTLADAWQNPGDITAIPSLSSTSVRNLDTDRYLEDASYLRLRNIVVGYTFNDLLPEDSFFKSLKIYAQAENLVTWSKWRGWDPESSFRESDFFNFPTPKIFTLGFDVKF